jgi:signal transduction histidine kinase
VKSGHRFGGIGQDSSAWLVLLFIVLGVATPAACVLWFMNEAAHAQADAARRSIAEAYRGQLTLLRDRLDGYWAGRAAALEQDLRNGEAADFARAVKAGTADSFILRNANGSPGYPAFTMLPTADSARASLLARAAQAEIRGLLRGPKELAIQAITGDYSAGLILNGRDTEGRLIAADGFLLALQLISPRDSRRAIVLSRLSRMLNDYETTSMPAAQRLFLMDEVRAIVPGVSFPTYNAERLAAAFLEADDSRPSGSGLQPTNVSELWRLSTRSGRVTALYSTNTVTAAMEAALGAKLIAKGTRVFTVPPGTKATGETVAAGAMLPGWQLALQVTDTTIMDEAARARMASYLWVGYFVIGAMAITGLLAGQFFRRQMRLARMKTDLVSAVSHELKTPLASMRLLVDSLLDDDAVADAVKTRDYLHLIAGENQRLTRLVENFLTFSRIERNRQSLEMQAIQPADVVEAAAGIVRERFAGSDCQFSSSVEADLPAIYADPDALLSALLNLLDNAYKYTPSNKRIRLESYSEPGQVVFAVEDNGVGIAAREQKRIFRRFYQVDRRLARETGGCGLGLSIVDSIVRAHGGSVRVSSRLGVGSTFLLSLPLRKLTT